MISKDLLEYDVALILLVMFFAVILPIFFISAKIFLAPHNMSEAFKLSIMLPPTIFLLIGCPIAFWESKRYRETKNRKDLEATIHRLWKVFFVLATICLIALIVIWYSKLGI